MSPMRNRFFAGVVNAIFFASCFYLGIGFLLWLLTGEVR